MSTKDLDSQTVAMEVGIRAKGCVIAHRPNGLVLKMAIACVYK